VRWASLVPGFALPKDQETQPLAKACSVATGGAVAVVVAAAGGEAEDEGCDCDRENGSKGLQLR